MEIRVSYSMLGECFSYFFFFFFKILQGFTGGSDRRICLQCRRPEFDPWVGKIPSRWEQQPTLVFLSGKSHRQRILVGYSPWGHKEQVTTEQLSLHSQVNSTSLRTRGDGSYIDNIYFYFVTELSVLQMRKIVILWEYHCHSRLDCDATGIFQTLRITQGNAF